MSAVPNYKEMEEALLRASGTVLAYSSKHKIYLPAIQLNLYGRQSAGKSRLLNAFARRPLGFMKADTGNKCPVQYQFKTASTKAKEHCQITWRGKTETVDASAIYVKVQEVMVGVNGFTADVLQVSIELVDAMTICVVDMPGIRPPNAKSATEDNALIQEIWRTCAAAPSSIPIFVTQLYDDPQKMDDELESLKLLTAATPAALRRAIVVVTHLDAHTNHMGCGGYMDTLAKTLEEKGIGSKDSTVHCSLKPENFNPLRTREVDCQDPTALHAYFRDILVLDAQMLGHVPAELRQGYKVGIQEVVNVMVRAIVEHFKANSERMLAGLTDQFKGVEQSAKAVSSLGDMKLVRKDATKFVAVYCAYLAALARWDISGLRDTMRACGGFAVQPLEVNLPDEIALTFFEEMDTCRMRSSKFNAAFVALEPTFRQGIQTLLKQKLCGGSALLRLLRVWRVVVLKNVRCDYSVDEMQRMGCMSDTCETRAWNIEWCLKKMVDGSSAFLTTTVKEICEWTRRLFLLHAEKASEVVPSIITALQDTPTIRTQLTKQLHELYDQYLWRKVTEGEGSVVNNILCSFTSLKLDVPFALLRLLCSTDISKDMFKPQDVCHPDQGKLQGIVAGALASVEGVDANAKALLLSVCGMVNSNSYDAISNLFHVCAQLGDVVSTEDFALGEGTQLPRVLDTRLAEEAPLINSYGRAFTYMQNGIALINAVNEFDRKVEQPVKQLNQDIQLELTRALAKLTEENLTAMVVHDVPQRLKSITALQETLKDNHQAQADVLVACEKLGQRCNGTPSNSFDRVKKILDDTEKKLSSAQATPQAGTVKGLSDAMAEVANEDAPELTIELLLDKDAQIETLCRALKETERALAAHQSGGIGSQEAARVRTSLSQLRDVTAERDGLATALAQQQAAATARETQLSTRIADLEMQLQAKGALGDAGTLDEPPTVANFKIPASSPTPEPVPPEPPAPHKKSAPQKAAPKQPAPEPAVPEQAVPAT